MLMSRRAGRVGQPNVKTRSAPQGQSAASRRNGNRSTLSASNRTFDCVVAKRWDLCYPFVTRKPGWPDIGHTGRHAALSLQHASLSVATGSNAGASRTDNCLSGERSGTNLRTGSQNRSSFAVGGSSPPDRRMAVSTPTAVGSSRVDLQACKLEYSIVSPK